MNSDTTEISNKTEWHKVSNEVEQIALLMQQKIDSHSGKKGDSWKNIPFEDLMIIMQAELIELGLAIETRETVSALTNYNLEVKSKIVDSMNLLMFVHHRLED